MKKSAYEIRDHGRLWIVQCELSLGFNQRFVRIAYEFKGEAGLSHINKEKRFFNGKFIKKNKSNETKLNSIKKKHEAKVALEEEIKKEISELDYYKIEDLDEH